MNNVVKFLFTLIGAACLAGCVYLPKAKNVYSKEFSHNDCGKHEAGVVVVDPLSLYGSAGVNDARCYAIVDAKRALTRAVGQNSKKPLILFVHGRGAHPAKGLKKNLIYYLAEENNANVVMFHWPSYKGLLGYAKKSAWESAASLEKFLEEVINFTNAPGSPHQGTTILLVHSMGNIVVRELALQEAPVLASSVFDTLILNAPDVPWKEKAPPTFTKTTVRDPNAFWLDHIKIAKQQFLHVSRKDTILTASRWISNFGVQRLGRCMDKRKSKNFTFVDFNGTGVDHLYYIDQGPKKFPFKGEKWKGNPAIAEYFELALAGKTVDPANINGLYDASGGSVKVWRFFKTAARKKEIDCL